MGQQRELGLFAGSFIFDPRGRLLLIHENYGRRCWGLPGGVVDPGESPQRAAVREVLEETGLSVEVIDLVGMRWATDGEREFLGFGFRCRVISGTVAIQDPDEIAEIGWFSPDDLPEPTTNLLRQLLEAAIAGKSGIVLDHL